MSPLVLSAAVLAALAAGLTAGWWLPPNGHLPSRRRRAPAVRRILLPFAGLTISQRALDAAVRLAQAEHATLMPAYLARVPLNLPLDAPLERQCNMAMPVLDAIEQCAAERGVPVDSRIERGRSYRDALRRLLKSEHFDRVVVPAGATGQPGLTGDDLVWLLDRAPAEVVILRPDPEDRLTLSGEAFAGRL
jgi:hypothetical protein